MRGRSTIVITHRLDLARKADRIIVLDGARIVEHGSFPELQARQGRFAALFAVEAMAYDRLSDDPLVKNVLFYRGDRKAR